MRPMPQYDGNSAALSTTSSSAVRTRIRVIPWLAVSNAIGPSLIAVSIAVDRDHGGHRRWRITRRPTSATGQENQDRDPPRSRARPRGGACDGRARGRDDRADLRVIAGDERVPRASTRYVPPPCNASHRTPVRDNRVDRHRAPAGTGHTARIEAARRPSAPAATTENLLRTKRRALLCSKPASIG